MPPTITPAPVVTHCLFHKNSNLGRHSRCVCEEGGGTGNFETFQSVCLSDARTDIEISRSPRLAAILSLPSEFDARRARPAQPTIDNLGPICRADELR